MRSLLIQASSIEKAVEKAWLDAGKPTQFTIKILDSGEKGFLGLTIKKPAIVSIMYEPQKQATFTKAPKPQQQETPRQQKHKPEPVIKKEQTNKPQPQQAQPTRQQESQTQKTTDTEKTTLWTDILVDDLKLWIKEMIAILNLPTNFTTQINRKTLHITFEQPLLENKNEERFLFSSLSYLLINFMKKKHKKRYQGYQLMISSKQPAKENSN